MSDISSLSENPDRVLNQMFSSGGTKPCCFWSIYLKDRQGGKLFFKVNVSANWLFGKVVIINSMRKVTRWYLPPTQLP